MKQSAKVVTFPLPAPAEKPAGEGNNPYPSAAGGRKASGGRGGERARVVPQGEIPPVFPQTARWASVFRDAEALQSGQALLLRGIGYMACRQMKGIVAYRKLPLRVHKRGEDVYIERREE